MIRLATSYDTLISMTLNIDAIGKPAGAMDLPGR
jgi:hypothetical protein